MRQRSSARMRPCACARAQALEDLYTHYDMTVRNAAGGIVQFVYGDDGMDPVTMEGKGASALDFDRVLGKVRMRPWQRPCAVASARMQAARLCALQDLRSVLRREQGSNEGGH